MHGGCQRSVRETAMQSYRPSLLYVVGFRVLMMLLISWVILILFWWIFLWLDYTGGGCQRRSVANIWNDDDVINLYRILFAGNFAVFDGLDYNKEFFSELICKRIHMMFGCQWSVGKKKEKEKTDRLAILVCSGWLNADGSATSRTCCCLGSLFLCCRPDWE